MNGLKDARTALSVLLPHEVLHALATCNAAGSIFQSIMFGDLSPSDVEAFWTHCRTLDPWKNHPVLSDPSQTLSQLVGVQLHADGAEMFRDDECCCYSWSSIFGGTGLVTDVMLFRFPITLIQDRHMQQPEDSCFIWFCFSFAVVVEGFGVMVVVWMDGVLVFYRASFKVKRRVNKVLADVVAWSLKCAAKGVAPTKGFYNETFPSNAWRAKLAGEPIGNGFRTFGFA